MTPKPFLFCPLCTTELQMLSIHGEMRLACPAPDCEFVHWDNPTPIVAAIVEHNKHIILARNKQWPEKMFGLITGFLEKNEDPKIGVLREVKEELGLDGDIVDLVGLYISRRMNQLIIAYHVKAWGEIVLGEELVEAKAISPEKLKPWPFGTGRAVADWLSRR